MEEGLRDTLGVDPLGLRRHLALLFCDLCDYTALSEAIDPEETDALRRHVEQLATETIRKHGGSISQYYGDGILAVFGLPNAEEQDVRSAIDSALELRSVLRAWRPTIALPPDFQIGMHFGIHGGLVFARIGDPLHGRYELTGDAVNTTARLCSAAQRDEILISSSAILGIEPFYEVDDARELSLKGKRDKVMACRVRGASSVQTRFEASARRGLTAYVNRSDELVQLKGAAAGARDQTRLVVVVGAAGLGKTRLVDEFTHAVGGESAMFLRGYCGNYGNVAPLQPFIQVLRQSFQIRAEMPPEFAIAAVQSRCAALGPAVQAHTEVFLNALTLPSAAVDAPRDFHHQLTRALRALIEALSARGVVVLVVDDWQWADDLSHHMLRGLLNVVERGLLLVLAARQVDENDALIGCGERIELRPLHSDESQRLIRSLLPDALDVGLIARLCQRSGGNPLFLEELCRALPKETPQARQALARDEVPYTIKGVIQARMQRLPAFELEVLRTASVVGNDFNTALLENVGGYASLRTALEHLLACDLVRADDAGAYRFKHGITHEVVYESVRLSERVRVHATIAACLEERAVALGLAEPYEALAHHHLGAGHHERAAHYAELAGDKAALTSALDRARLQYGIALAELDKLPNPVEVRRRWLGVSVKWARAWVYDPAPEHLDVLERSKRYAQELADDEALADVEQMTAWICYALGDQERAIGHCRHGLELAERIGNQKLVGQLVSNLGQSYAAAGDNAAAIDCLDRAIRIKKERAGKRERAVPVGFAYALAALATVHVERGEFELAQTEIERALGAVLGTGHAIEAPVFAVGAMIELWQGRFQRCIATCAHASVTAERIQGPYVFSISQAMSSYASFMLDNQAAHCERLCKAARWLEQRRMGLYLSMVFGCAAEVCLLAGDDEGARDFAQRALRRAEARDPFGRAVAHGVLATLTARRTHPTHPEVEAHFARASLFADTRGSKRDAALVRLWRAGLQQA